MHVEPERLALHVQKATAHAFLFAFIARVITDRANAARALW
jgi:hypothetical protein